MAMPSVLDFSRNRSTSVEQMDQQTMRAACRLQDTLTEAFVEIQVRLPDLEIISVKGEVYRTDLGPVPESTDCLQKVKGVRVGSGMLKIIKGLIGEDGTGGQLTFMVEECCHGIILAFTKDTLNQAPRGQDLPAEIFQEMVKANIRLYNRCAAFAQGSSLVEGLEPPK